MCRLSILESGGFVVIAPNNFGVTQTTIDLFTTWAYSEPEFPKIY